MDVIRANDPLHLFPNADPELVQRAAVELGAFTQRVFGLAAEAIFRTWVDGRPTQQTAQQNEPGSHGGGDDPKSKGKETATESSEGRNNVSPSSDQTPHSNDPMRTTTSPSTAPSLLAGAAQPSTIADQSLYTAHFGVDSDEGTDRAEVLGISQDHSWNEGQVDDLCFDNHFGRESWDYPPGPGFDMPPSGSGTE